MRVANWDVMVKERRAVRVGQVMSLAWLGALGVGTNPSRLVLSFAVVGG